jgi:hypothetical protein
LGGAYRIPPEVEVGPPECVEESEIP